MAEPAYLHVGPSPSVRFGIYFYMLIYRAGPEGRWRMLSLHAILPKIHRCGIPPLSCIYTQIFLRFLYIESENFTYLVADNPNLRADLADLLQHSANKAFALCQKIIYEVKNPSPPNTHNPSYSVPNLTYHT